MLRVLLLVLFLAAPATAQVPGTSSVRVTNTSGQSVASVLNTTPTGTEYGLAVRMIGTITATISGTVAVTQSGTWTVGVNANVLPAGGAFAGTGQQAVTGSAAALPSLSTKQVCVTHVSGGSQTVVYVGSTSGVTTSTGFPLQQGQALCMPVSNVNLVYVIAASTGSSVAYAGVN